RSTGRDPAPVSTAADAALRPLSAEPAARVARQGLPGLGSGRVCRRKTLIVGAGGHEKGPGVTRTGTLTAFATRLSGQLRARQVHREPAGLQLIRLRLSFRENRSRFSLTNFSAPSGRTEPSWPLRPGRYCCAFPVRQRCRAQRQALPSYVRTSA